ncbi:hypothetical protein LTR49_028473 [Elasticomyces elasticus]|nr:hypothetical protein LTR49_028473 [Elasticomyces elasticus]
MEDVPKQQHLLPAAIDYRAKHTPNRVFAILPKGDSLADGFFNLTYAGLAKAVDSTAWWLEDVLGAIPTEHKFTDFPTVPYIGPNDYRYHLLLLAAMKTGRKVMFPFAANTPEGLARLLELSNSKVALATPTHSHIWKEQIARKPDIRLIEVPEITEFIHEKSVNPYAYVRVWEEGIEDPQVLIQTSGTTGTPKPIILNNRWTEEYHADVAQASRHAPQDQQIATYAILENTSLPNFLPLSWVAGIAMTLWCPLYVSTVPIMLPAASMTMTPTAEHIKAVGKYAPRGQRNGIMLVPDMLRHLVREEEGHQSLKVYEWVGYVGAPLDHETGDAITAMGIRVQSCIGSTDTGLYNLLLNDRKDWKYHRFPDGLHNFYMDPFSDELFELCTKRGDNDPRPVFVMNPDMDVYRTRDLWRAVDGRPGFFSNAGRVDDFVKLSTMTKFNAMSIEQIVESNPVVAKCLIAGNSRVKPFIIVEPSPDIGMDDDTPEAEVIERMWPAIAAANEHLLPEMRLSKELTLITLPGKGIIRTAKGTVQRRNNLDTYEKIIEQKYMAAGYEAVPFTATGEANINAHP